MTGITYRSGHVSKGFHTITTRLWNSSSSAVAFKKENLWILYGAHHQVLGWFGKMIKNKIILQFFFSFPLFYLSHKRWNNFCSAVKYRILKKDSGKLSVMLNCPMSIISILMWCWFFFVNWMRTFCFLFFFLSFSGHLARKRGHPMIRVDQI